MVRLKDIAEAARVSVMTVSKALRDKPDLSAATKARIRQLASQMGYVPNLGAAGMRSRTTRLLGLLIPATTDPIYSRVILALEQSAMELGYDLVLAHSLGRVDREETMLRRLLARRVDGLFVSPVYRLEDRAPVYEELRARRIPTVILGPPAPFCAGFPSVATDDLGSAAAMTRHLLELGHRRIAFLAGPLVAPWAQGRMEGYRQALREAGLAPDHRMVFNAGATIEEGAAAALQFIQEDTGATALQAVNDLVAIGAAHTLLNQGVRIPQDLSVAGHGNVLTSEFFRVPLTTVRQPKLRLGSVAMDLMGRLLRGEPAESKRLPAELVPRASTAPPPSPVGATAD
ncbi:MAG: LacI family DNA-binding transcriptional regulator [Verrucomicrobiota bacterium]